MKKYLLLLICFISFLILNVNAEEYYIDGTDVRLRRYADSNSDKLLVFPNGAVITVLNSQVVVGPGCSSGWLNVSYNGSTGYVCKEYVALKTSNASYGRPWTTPKKSIVGGAEFIYKNYLSNGQHLSYLKKFNVNPANSNVFSNQYMANIGAPASEARSSYTSYSKNGLLDLPLVFEVPIYDNMGGSTYWVGIVNTEVEETTETDADFENTLNTQGFDESYKLKLRALHKKHPNWQFKSLKTNLDFNYAVQKEMEVGAMPNNSGHCSGGPDSEEPGWCIPDYNSTAFYLDPRNFLSEKYVLQFESLFFNESHTEAVVQSMLNGTAMADLSVLDGQTFASIFVEAGRTHNVSPVYLASLARQETGNGTGFSARGEAFTYDGIYYDGNLFNYFNIGASGGDNPVLKGLVWASAGYTNNSGNANPSGTSQNSYIDILGAVQSGSYLKGFTFDTTVSALKAKVGGRANIIVTDSSGNVASNDALLGTGSRIIISDGTSSYTFTIVINGDINGDGSINSADLLKVRQYLVGTVNLSDAYLSASDINKDGTINSADLLRVRQQLLGTVGIEQN